jgi:hypothetical protein
MEELTAMQDNPSESMSSVFELWEKDRGFGSEIWACKIEWAACEGHFSRDYSDSELEQMWADIEDIPVDPETEEIEIPVLGFPAGTHREEIWYWFDERYSAGVSGLMGVI